jgi:large subunit ribosomal protein L21
MSYAVIKTGGKQYRVEEGTTLLVERLSEDEGAKVSLEPLLYADGDKSLFSSGDLGKVKVEATVVGHERGPKLRVFKFKPKRGYKRRTGHRQELTRIQVTGIKVSGGRPRAAKKDEEEA